MGNRYREPRAKSAERLRMTGVQAKIQPDSHQILMTAEFTYDSWDAPIDCDVINAVTVLHEIVEKAFDKASEKRYKKLNAEYAGILDGHDDTENGTLVAQDIIARQAAATKTFHAAIDADEGTGVHVESCRDRGCFGCEDVTRFHDLFDNS